VSFDGVALDGRVALVTGAGSPNDDESARRLVREVEDGLGAIDVLVNSAGIVQTGRATQEQPFTEVTSGEWRWGIELNLHPGSSYVTGQSIVIDGGNLLQESKLG
jgi:NADP-dependent 3-hydroxy acid dehydrogenase YdfG